MFGFAARRRAASPGPPAVVVHAADPVLPEGLAGDLEQVSLVVEGLSALLDLTAGCAGRVRTSSLTIEISPARIARLGPETRLGRIPGVTAYSLRSNKKLLVATVRCRTPVDLAVMLRGVVEAVAPAARSRAGSGRTDLALLVPSRAVAPFVSVADQLLRDDELDPELVRPADVLVVDADTPPVDSTVAERVVVATVGLPACVDRAIHHPIGRDDFTLPMLSGRVRAGGVLELTAPTGEVLRPTRRHGVDDLGVKAMLPYVGVRFDRAPADPHEDRVLRQLSACGLVVSVKRTADEQRTLDDPLGRLWAEPWPVAADDLEQMSVRQRRVAHRDHSTARVGAQDPAGGAPSVSVLLSCSRAEFLEAALRGIAEFDYPRLQVVLGLHGVQAPAMRPEWLEPFRSRDGVVVREFDAGLPFGAVLADLSSRADGDLLTKVDDDDLYGRDHLWDLVVAHEYSGAAVVGKLAEYVYLDASDTTVRRAVPPRERYGRTVAGGTIMISRAALATVGGWRPVPRSVDRGLIDRVLRSGGGVYRTHGHNFVYVRHANGHTWDMPDDFVTDAVGRWDGLVRPGVRD